VGFRVSVEGVSSRRGEKRNVPRFRVRGHSRKMPDLLTNALVGVRGEDLLPGDGREAPDQALPEGAGIYDVERHIPNIAPTLSTRPIYREQDPVYHLQRRCGIKNDLRKFIDLSRRFRCPWRHQILVSTAACIYLYIYVSFSQVLCEETIIAQNFLLL
jgi:hypothetical protein